MLCVLMYLRAGQKKTHARHCDAWGERGRWMDKRSAGVGARAVRCTMFFGHASCHARAREFVGVVKWRWMRATAMRGVLGVVVIGAGGRKWRKENRPRGRGREVGTGGARGIWGWLEDGQGADRSLEQGNRPKSA